ncbi:LysM peptidoglycan-binding domain-containing protein [Kiritimatiellota bacterium B12222]|nr:LysM peptidoglycan-binding domain-containing protein [Kiritimatiellota bacterium B12222]
MLKPSLLLLITCIFGSTACVQTRQPSSAQLAAQQRAAQERQLQLQQAEQRQRVQMQLEDTDVRLQESQLQVQQLRAELAKTPTQGQIQALENRLNHLEQTIQQMEVQRAKDREEIIEILSQRISKVLSQQQAVQAQASGRTHVVASGETLSTIAAAYRVSSQRVIQANNISNPNNLRVGQKLVIPGN